MESNRLAKLLDLQALYPEDLFNSYAVAMEYLGLGNNKKAKDGFMEVIQNDKNYISAYYQLGIIYLNENNEVEALLALENGLKSAQLKNDKRAMTEFRTLIDEISL